MATNYIKVRPHVAEKLGLTGQRSTYPDGCVQLFEKDLSLIDRGYVFGRRDQTVARIGGLLFDPWRNRDEHRLPPEESTPLPEPTDPFFALPEPTEESEESPGETPEPTQESEEPTEESPTGNGGAPAPHTEAFTEAPAEPTGNGGAPAPHTEAQL